MNKQETTKGNALPLEGRMHYAGSRCFDRNGEPRISDPSDGYPVCHRPRDNRRNQAASVGRSPPLIQIAQHFQPRQLHIAHPSNRHPKHPPEIPGAVSRQLCRGVSSLYCCYSLSPIT
jgi:hypothetical protein